MNALDLEREWLALPDIGRGDRQLLEQQGVSREATTMVDGVSVIPITVTGRLWMPSAGGSMALVLPVFDEDEDLVDLVALRTSDPTEWWLRLGFNDLIHGASWLEDAHLTGQPVRHFMTPLAWLAAGGEGVCLLDHCASRWEVSRFAENDSALRKWWRAAS